MHTATATAAGTALATLALLTSTALAQTASLTIIEPPAGSIGTMRMDSARSARTMSVRSTTANGPGGVDLRWTEAAGTAPYAGAPSGGVMYGISSNGERAVGHNFTAPRTMYTLANGSVTNLGLPDGRAFEQQFIGANAWTNDAGTWVIANFRGAGDSRVPFRWTQAGGWQSLGALRVVSRVRDVTPDGSVMVGNSLDFNSFGDFVYRVGQGYTELPFGYSARAITDDGALVCGGFSENGTSVPALIQGAQMTLLPGLSGSIDFTALDVANNGSIAVGAGTVNGTVTAFVWTPTGGTRSLQDYLTDFNLALPANLGVTDIAITGDGSMISGTLGLPSGTRAFAIIIPAPTSLALASMCFALARRRR